MTVSPLALSLQDITGPNNSACKQALEAKTTPRGSEVSPRVALSNVSSPQREHVRAPASVRVRFVLLRQMSLRTC